LRKGISINVGWRLIRRGCLGPTRDFLRSDHGKVHGPIVLGSVYIVTFYITYVRHTVNVNICKLTLYIARWPCELLKSRGSASEISQLSFRSRLTRCQARHSIVSRMRLYDDSA
jgi:hypothetical protein